MASIEGCSGSGSVADVRPTADGVSVVRGVECVGIVAQVHPTGGAVARVSDAAGKQS